MMHFANKMNVRGSRLHVLVAAFSRESRRALLGMLRAVGVESIVEAASTDDALILAHRSEINLALVAPRMTADPSDDSGLELVAELCRRRALTAVIVGDEPNTHSLRRAMQHGARDWWVCRELDVPILRERFEELSAAASCRTRSLSRPEPQPPRPCMLGRSPAMMQLREQVARAAKSRYPVLVRGPSGAGKELVVQELHQLGPRPDTPLLDLNCGAIPGNLLESQLFGHKRGSFTGASRDQEGYLSATGSGSLFLDEVAELPLALQAKLLRVLESGCYRMVGSTSPRVFAGRVIAATHADLETRFQAKLFREDLFYRLAVLEVRVPALAERREDIPLLLDHFIVQHGRHFELGGSALEWLMAYDWPGNVRQLRNLVARLALLSDAQRIDVATIERFLHRPARKSDEQEALSRLADTVLDLDCDNKLHAAQDAIIQRSLVRHGGNKSAAARALGIHRKVLERRLVKSASSRSNGQADPGNHHLDHNGQHH